MKILIILSLVCLSSLTFADHAVTRDKICSDDYSQSVRRCGSITDPDDDKDFFTCLESANTTLFQCCNTSDASATCTDGASVKDQAAADKLCFASYSQSVGRCSSTTDPDSDEGFFACLEPVKIALAQCCDTHYGSTACAENAK